MAQMEGGVARLRCLHNGEKARLVFADTDGYQRIDQSGDGDEAAELRCAYKCRGCSLQNRRTSRSFQTRWDRATPLDTSFRLPIAARNRHKPVRPAPQEFSESPSGRAVVGR